MELSWIFPLTVVVVVGAIMLNWVLFSNRDKEEYKKRNKNKLDL